MYVLKFILVKFGKARLTYEMNFLVDGRIKSEMPKYN